MEKSNKIPAYKPLKHQNIILKMSEKNVQNLRNNPLSLKEKVKKAGFV